MRLFYYQGWNGKTNFGDELNKLIWQKLLPEIFDGTSSELFLGIGTLLDDRVPDAAKIVVMGSGVGYGHLPTKAQINSWLIYCLRGRLSAQSLGVSSNLVATDPAILVSQLFPGQEKKIHEYAYMPHWQNMGNGWIKVSEKMGIRLLNPRDSVVNLITAMKQSKVIITEAMHGAIVADSLRIPWIAVNSRFDDYCSFKWQDWCSSLNLDYKSYRIGNLLHTDFNSDSHWVKKVGINMFNAINIRNVEKELNKIIASASPMLSDGADFVNARKLVIAAIQRFKNDFQKK